MSEAHNDTVDRAAAYGDGAFESIAVRNGVARFWEAHVERLQTACMRLGLRQPTAAELADVVQEALAAAGDEAAFGTLRLVASAAPSPRGYRRKHDGAISLSARLHTSRRLDPEFVRNGVAVRVCNVRLAQQPALAGIKSLNRLEQVLARAEWDDPNVFEGLTLDTDGRLICGTMSNVFIVKENEVATPGITRCGVAGIMRARVVQQLKEAGIACDVRDIDAGELDRATEVFLSNSQFGVLPVNRIDGHEYPVGAITRRVQELLAADDVPECLA